MRENKDQKNSEYGHFSRNRSVLFIVDFEQISQILLLFLLLNLKN